MSNVYEASIDYEDDFNDVEQFCSDTYDSDFLPFLGSVKDLYIRMQSDSKPISDSELESILTELPMNLFMASEKLNAMKLKLEVLKLKNKERRDELQAELSNKPEFSDMKPSDKKDVVSRELFKEMLDYDILSMAFNSIISRVENEISFARELIMGSKKIWDSRRSSEQSNPVGEIVKDDVVKDLPEYKMGSKSYVR